MAAKAPAKQYRLTDDDAKNRAAACRAAMKGLGCDDDELIRQLCSLTSEQAKQVVQAYTDTIHRDLAKDLDGETSGNLKKILTWGLLSAPEIDATLVRTAYKGIGCDDMGLIEVICTRTDAEIQAASQVFKKMFEAFMRDDVVSDCSGDFKKLMDTVLTAAEKGGRRLPPLTQVDDDVLRLYKAGEGKIGTNESVFIEIIGGNHRAYVEKVADAYGHKYGKSLVSVIKSEMSGSLQQGLVALVQPPAEFLGDRLYHAMKGMGTDDKVVIRIVMAERDRWLRSINEYFLKKYERSLPHWLEGEFSGHAKKALMELVHARGM